MAATFVQDNLRVIYTNNDDKATKIIIDKIISYERIGPKILHVNLSYGLEIVKLPTPAATNTAAALLDSLF